MIVVVAVWGGVLAAKTWSAYRHDQRGLAALELVRSNLTPGELTASGLVHSLDVARAEFAGARSDLSSPLFVPVTVLPVVGRQLRAVRALSGAAETVSQVGASFLSDVHGVLNQPHGAGPDRVV